MVLRLSHAPIAMGAKNAHRTPSSRDGLSRKDSREKPSPLEDYHILAVDARWAHIFFIMPKIDIGFSEKNAGKGSIIHSEINHA